MIDYKKIVPQFICLTVLLIVVGFLMQNKVGSMLNDTLEQTIARRTADMSAVASERFDREPAELRFASDYITAHPSSETETNIIAALGKKDARISVGLLRLDGTAILGAPLSRDEFPRLPMAVHGNNVVDYCAGKGLLFAVPVLNGDNVRAVVRRLYPEALLTDMFGLAESNSASRFLIQDRNGQIIMPYKNYGDEDKAFFDDPSIAAGFDTVCNELLDKYAARAAAIYYEGERGKFFLFGADLPQTNCRMIGYVPWSAVAGTISHTNTLIIIILTSLMLMLFLVASVCLILINGKANRFERAKARADFANQAKSAFLTSSTTREIQPPPESLCSH